MTAPESSLPAAPGADPVVRAEGVSLVFGDGAAACFALRDVSLTLNSGEFVGVVGPSGSGKTVLLNTLAGYAQPTEGRIFYRGQDLWQMSRPERERLRARHCGWVPREARAVRSPPWLRQSLSWVPILGTSPAESPPCLYRSLTVLQNLERVLRHDLDVPKSEAREKAAEMADLLFLAPSGNRRPHHLSGGQVYRLLIGMAIIKRPALCCIDETLAQLDRETGTSILHFLRRLVSDLGLTVVVSTHEDTVPKVADRILRLRDGRLVGDSAATTPGPPA
jgi:putative ABC transport system ATP-binding protein